MDQQLSAEIQDSIAKIEAKLKELQQLSALNTNLGQANQALAEAAQTLSSASGQFPPTLTELKSLSDRLAQLARVLEGSDLAVLVGKVGQLESDLKSVTETLDRLSAETGGKLQAISIEVDDIKSVLGRSSGETSDKLQALSIEVDETKSLINELQAFTQKKATQSNLFVFATSVVVVAAVIAVRFIS